MLLRAASRACARSAVPCRPALPRPLSSAAGGSGGDAVTPTHPSGLNFWGEGKGMGVDLPPNRAPLYQEAPPNYFVKRYYYLLKTMGVFSAKARVGVNSEAIFRSLEEQATHNFWFEALHIERSWATEHALIALHVWLLHNRFKVDFNVPGDFNGRRMQEELFQRLWDDTTLRIRNAGVAEISVNRQLDAVQKMTFDEMYAYDAAVKAMAGSSGDDNLELAGALWKAVFRESQDADTPAVLRLSEYVCREMQNILLHPKEDLYRGWIMWGPGVGETAEGRLARQRSLLQGEWRDALAPDGRVFFYHTTTHERRWDPPPAGLTARRRFALARALNPEQQQPQQKLGEGGGGEEESATTASHRLGGLSL